MFCVACCGRGARLVRRVRAHGPKIARDSSTRAASTDSSPLRHLLEEASAFGEAAAAEGELQWATQPYAAAPGARGAPRVQPADTTVLLLPGEGAARSGMGRRLQDVPAARDLYQLASEVLGWDVWRTCTEGSPKEVSEKAAECVLVTCLAGLERARDERPATVERVRAVAGYSVGELGALVVAGALSLEGALRVAGVRAAGMRACAADRPGASLTVWLRPDANLPHALLRARDHAAARGVSAPVAQVSAYLYPGCKVVAGDEQAISWLERSGEQFGVRRSARVEGAGAWHSALMEGARGPVRDALRAVGGVRDPRVQVWGGAAGAVYGGGGAAARGVERGVARAVRWEQALHGLYARPRPRALPATLLLGGGDQLRHALRQVNARAFDRALLVPV